MPRNRLLTQIHEEMVHSKASLKYWRGELVLLTGTGLESIVKREIAFREREADELLNVQEQLIEMTDTDAVARLQD